MTYCSCFQWFKDTKMKANHNFGDVDANMNMFIISHIMKFFLYQHILKDYDS